jgi:hypothetical protein
MWATQAKSEQELFADCAKQASQRLIQIGCSLDANARPEKILIAYFGVKRRLIATRPRTVLIAKNLRIPASFHEVVRKAEAGEDLTPYQSRRFLSKPSKDDALLSDWGIQHLHFDMGLDPNNRSSDLLFARITEDAFYCIDISDHRGFTRQIMLEILDSDWPESIARFLLQGSIAGESVTDEQVGNLRKANVNAFVQLPNGRTYSLGCGRSSSGDNILDVRECARLFVLCREAAKAMAKDGLDANAWMG